IQKITYEKIMVAHKDALASINITLCKECFYPIKLDKDEYCNN
ncbi:18910_t:CDS:1, partial [Gigaspora margarita]